MGQCYLASFWTTFSRFGGGDFLQNWATFKLTNLFTLLCSQFSKNVTTIEQLVCAHFVYLKFKKVHFSLLQLLTVVKPGLAVES